MGDGADMLDEWASRQISGPTKFKYDTETPTKPNTMISKVKNVQGNGSFENQYGAQQEDGKKLLFSFEYEFEDGTILKANHKTSTPTFAAGDSASYEVTEDDPKYGKKGKVKKPEYEGKPFKESTYTPTPDNLKGIKIGHAITNGVQLAITIKGAEVTGGDVEMYANRILELAEKMNAEPSKDVPIEPPLQSSHYDEDDSSADLPF